MTITASEREALRIANLRRIAADESVNNFARSICLEAAEYLAERAAVAWRVVGRVKLEQLARLWLEQQATYPDTNMGKAAAAAVRLCAKELTDALSERAAGEPVAWRWKKRINCGQGQFIEGHWIYTDTDPKADHVDFPSIIAYEPLYAAPDAGENHG